MGVLKPGDYSGPVRGLGDCGCANTNSLAPVTSPPNFVPGISVCDSSAPGNQPVGDPTYQCSLGVTLQSVIDSGRRVAHELGMRPYRVYLVWQERDRTRAFVEHCRVELMPVRVTTMDSLDLSVEVWGKGVAGGISLREISPQQVNEDELVGFIDGENWPEKSDSREFFYEVALRARCPDHVPKVRRFAPSGVPFHDAAEFAFQIALVDQKIARSRSLLDQTVATENEDQTSLPPTTTPPGPRLVF